MTLALGCTEAMLRSLATRMNLPNTHTLNETDLSASRRDAAKLARHFSAGIRR